MNKVQSALLLINNLNSDKLKIGVEYRKLIDGTNWACLYPVRRLIYENNDHNGNTSDNLIKCPVHQLIISVKRNKIYCFTGFICLPGNVLRNEANPGLSQSPQIQYILKPDKRPGVPDQSDIQLSGKKIATRVP